MKKNNGLIRRTRALARRALPLALIAAAALAADNFRVFAGQVNGPVRPPGKTDLASFAHRRYPGLYWSEVYYHEMSFPDETMITVQLGLNPKDATIVFAYCKPGAKPFTEYLVVDVDEARFDSQGFGVTIGESRVWLAGDKYHLSLDFGRVKARITYEILSPSYSFGDSMLRYPDGRSFTSYSFPIPWARVKGQATIAGEERDLEGFGSMNHDAGVLSPIYTPNNWQAFWFYGPDHALMIADFYTNQTFGHVLVQRLLFVDKDGNMFSSTDFTLKWDDWVDAKDIPFRYPRHYSLTAEGGGAKLSAEIKARDVLILEDLYSNLPAALRVIAKQITRNGWTADYWSDYDLTYTHDGHTDTYHGRGITRWTDLEKEKE